MAKFNEKNTVKTVNKSGHVAYDMKDKEKLVTMVLTTFFGEPKFYGDNSNDLVELATTVAQNEPKFVSNLAVYARQVYHLRSVAHVLTCIVAHENETKQYTKRTVTGVVERADDLTEILACYISMYGKPIPNGLKKALAANIKKFDEYSLAKYNRDSASFKFKDILKLTHVKPNGQAQSQLFKKVLEDNLETPITWETELSARGNKKEVWEDLIEDNRLGYMAMLRNLRNIINAQPDNINKVYAKLGDEKEVARSKQLPFRFFSAYREIEHLSNTTNKALDALEKALSCSVANLPKLEGKTIIAFDMSGSMNSAISRKSTTNCFDIARLLAVLASKISDEYIVFAFDTSINKVSIATNDGILSTVNRIHAQWGGTNIKLPLMKMLSDGIKADRLIILSDNEINSGWNGYKSTCQSLADRYRKEINPNLWVHAIDLQGYGTQQFIGSKTNIIAGWSERTLEFINLAEAGINTQVKDIENYDC
jgi:hypothetical protein